MVMGSIRIVSYIILILGHCAFAYHHSCLRDGCRNGAGKLMCQSCNPGCYGEKCTNVCLGECDPDGCDRTTGKCFKCKPGRYGPECNQRCSNDCPLTRNDGEAYCDRQTGLCQEFCDGGKTGLYCHEDCPTNCKMSICTKVGAKCPHGCKDGWYGPQCSISCTACVQRKCAVDGYCLLNCEKGFYGDRCDKECPHCYTTGCDRRSGICEQCEPGYYGKQCKQLCSAKCYQGRDGHRHCDRHSGRCLEGCESGYHGAGCNTPCNKNCRQNMCYGTDGSCVHPCKQGRYGSHCHATCENCLSGCNRHSGVCIDGCIDGYYGERCDKECKQCAKCNQITGHCVTCPVGQCGDNCTNSCHNCHDKACHINGTCINGCKSSYHGHSCQNKCNQNCEICNQLSGECDTCMQNFVLENGQCKPTASPLQSSTNSAPLIRGSTPLYILLFVFFIRLNTNLEYR